MSELLKVKIRKIGTSYGIILPKEKLDIAHLGENDEVEVALLSHSRDFSGFGIAKHFKPFQHDRNDRHW